MLLVPTKYRRYNSVHKRFLKPAIENFFKLELGRNFGPNLRGHIADSLVEIFNENCRDIKTLKAGQVLWNAVSEKTRADSKKMKLVSIVLTLINDQDIEGLKNDLSITEHKENVIARILLEAFEQGALLSMRDVSLLLVMSDSAATLRRKNYEERHNVTLPHTGNLHDMGSCITHKYQIVYKYVVEKKDPLTVSRETNHRIEAVDRYLKDFNRVKTLYLDNKEESYINTVTGISLYVIKQYVEIINEFVKTDKNNC